MNPTQLDLDPVLTLKKVEKHKYFEPGSTPLFSTPESCKTILKIFRIGDGLREDKSTKIIAKKVGDYHSARTNQSYEEQVASPINHLKKLNNNERITIIFFQLYKTRAD